MFYEGWISGSTLIKRTIFSSKPGSGNNRAGVNILMCPFSEKLLEINHTLMLNRFKVALLYFDTMPKC